jgi:hypothetical protein
MMIQKHLGEVPEPYSRLHIEGRIPDSYSRMIDHEVGEWEQPYGYDVKPLEPEQYEKMEHKGKYAK